MWVAPTTMMLCTLLGYIDRQVLAALSPTILKDTGMTAGDYGWAVSAFSITYMIMNPVFGSIPGSHRAAARHGDRRAHLDCRERVACRIERLDRVRSARALLGFGEGAAFPGALRTAAEALPVNKQSRGMALGYSGASMGALITPPLIIPIAGRYGWRFAFLLTGFLGVLWLILVVARRPAAVPAETDADEQARGP